MDKKNYSNCNQDNVIGDITAGRSTRNRPAALTAQEDLKNMPPNELLGQGLMQLWEMARTMHRMAAKKKSDHEANHEEEDNEISLPGPHGVSLEQPDRRENEQSKLRQPPDEAKR